MSNHKIESGLNYNHHIPLPGCDLSDALNGGMIVNQDISTRTGPIYSHNDIVDLYKGVSTLEDSSTTPSD
jgi:hypothetical protein